MRLVVLILTIGTIILYAHALAGLGGYLLGKGRPWMILYGLTGGTCTAVLALWLWKKYLLSLSDNGENDT
ncbi:MAG: hypothetical protein JW971_01895 [Synergistales bacterium]|nr:hypothetical protein [Synergistales bacterium]